MNKEIDWFCFHAVSEGLLSVEQCTAVIDAIRDAEIEVDLAIFVQTIVENELCDNPQHLQELSERSIQEARALGFPPTSIFDDDSETVPVKPAPVEPPPPVQTTQPAKTASPSLSATSLKELPTLVGVDSLSDQEAGDFLASYLCLLREMGASDLHLSAGARPFYRRNLTLHYLEENCLGLEASAKLNLAPLTSEQREVFKTNLDLDYSLALDDHNRFRVNLMQHKNGIKGSYRLIPNRVRSLEELGFKNTAVIKGLLDNHNGLILVTGPVGSGKTTTLAAMVDLLNQKRRDHVITVEDPIEIVQGSLNCNITQREIGRHTNSYHSALKAALREDPDIIVIGEMRDLETIEMAITAAETGHLVIGTLHTSDAASTLTRVLDVFPPAQQAQIRAMTAESLRGVICQRLLPSVEDRLVVAAEILLSNTAVGNIIRENKMFQLKAVLQTGTSQGMTTMDNAIKNLFTEGVISAEVAAESVLEKQLAKEILNPQGAGSDGKGKGDDDGKSGGESPAKKKKGWFK
jgi:twitching motility protein PilT